VVNFFSYLHIVKESDNFYERVYTVARLIPFGRVTSYGAIANYLGAARSARMVGWAMNNSHNQKEEVPAHRVVNRKGLLTGKHHFKGTNLMQQLLESEGLVVIENQIQDFEKVFWSPMDASASKKE
jgi:methylated-DNA-protein-cysteine methyltransferase-like protein